MNCEQIEESETSQFYFIGNLLCLDFVNTEVEAENRKKPFVSNFAELVAWIIDAKIANKEIVEFHLHSWSEEIRVEALRLCLQFREALAQMTRIIVDNESILTENLLDINRWLGSRRGYRIIEQSKNGFEENFKFDEEKSSTSLNKFMYPIAESAVELLVHCDLKRVKQCESEHCSLYFYDTSKNQSRRWCSMMHCGNRNKVAAHYRRKRNE